MGIAAISTAILEEYHTVSGSRSGTHLVGCIVKIYLFA